MKLETVTVDSFNMLLQQITADFKRYEELFAILGVCFVGKVTVSFILNLVKGIKTHVLSKVRQQNLVQKYGKWAVITGSTDGIGKEFAKELARRGLNIVLVSRNITKLNKVASEIRDEYGVEVKVIQADFAQGAKAYPAIASGLESIDLGILVNNVGTITECACYIKEMTEEEIWDQVNVNVAAVTIMTRKLLPRMISQNRGAVVNVASIAAVKPVPLQAVYSATKAYIDYFSTALRHECKLLGATGVTVQTLIPSTVKTKMLFSERQQINIVTPDPESYARHAIATLGWASRSTGYWFHGLEAWLASVMPLWMWMYGASVMNTGFRSEFLRKKSNEKSSEDTMPSGRTAEVQQEGLHKRM